MTAFEEKWISYKEEFLEDLRTLVAIPSVRDAAHAAPNAPFGPAIRQVFDRFLEIAQKCGLETHDIDGYACDARLGNCQSPYIGVLGHLDVVEAGDSALWRTPPFVMRMDENETLYGRGVNDDKGPLLACLYVMRILKELRIPCKYGIRIIAGGAEETTWECMRTYFAQEPQPIMGFSPDGNFPIVNGEKGIRKYDFHFPQTVSTPNLPWISGITCSTTQNYVCDQVSVTLEPAHITQTFTGIRALSRNPQRGQNALLALAEQMHTVTLAQSAYNRCFSLLHTCFSPDTDGTACGIASYDAEMGAVSVCPTGLVQNADGLHLYVDVRYPRSTTPERLDTQIETLSKQYDFSYTVTDQKKLLYVPPQHPLLSALSEAYTQVTKQPAQYFTKGGASYARMLDCGIAFGATFPDEDPRPHMPNECMSFATLSTAAKIYYEALVRLASAELYELPQ